MKSFIFAPLLVQTIQPKTLHSRDYDEVTRFRSAFSTTDLEIMKSPLEVIRDITNNLKDSYKLLKQYLGQNYEQILKIFIEYLANLGIRLDNISADGLHRFILHLHKFISDSPNIFGLFDKVVRSNENFFQPKLATIVGYIKSNPMLVNKVIDALHKRFEDSPADKTIFYNDLKFIKEKNPMFFGLIIDAFFGPLNSILFI